MLCPRCQVDLAMTDRQGVEIDYCPKCRGIWLDRGELDKILDRSLQDLGPAGMPAETSPPPRPAPGYTPPYAHQDDRWVHQHRHKRKKTFLQDLFDF